MPIFERAVSKPFNLDPLPQSNTCHFLSALLEKRSLMPKIQFTTPEGASGEVELTAERTTLGRSDDNMVVIPDDSMSGSHAEITFTGDMWVLTDLGSTNGTKIDGERIEQVQLMSGGAFTLGSVECAFFDENADAAQQYEQSAAPTHTASGYGSAPYDASARRGFGAKKKEKGGSGAIIGLGILAILACGATGFMVSQMSA